MVLVAVVADRVSEAGDIEPPDRHTLAEVRGGQQTVDLLLVGVRRLVGEERRGLGGRRRQAGQVQGGAAQQPLLGGFGGGNGLFLGELGADEGIDRVLAAGGHCRDGGSLERLVGPVRLVDGSLGDPAAEELFLGICQRLVRLLFRHDVFGVGREDAFDDLTLIRLARYDRDRAALAGLQRVFAEIEAQAAFTGLRIEAVAMEAGVRHDRTDVAIEADGVG